MTVDLQARLRITEIFYSLQGETDRVGLPTAFIRLTGCPLRCQYCDTAYAFQGGSHRTIAEVLHQIAAFATRFVTVTGGEPLAQPACLPLLTALCDHDYAVSLETSGALSVAEVDARVSKILDIKTPGSGEEARNLMENLAYLTPLDQVKFVICDHADFLWSQRFITQHDLSARCPVLFSPSYQQVQPAQLADWILAAHLPVRMQIQMHKYIWGDVPGR